MKKILCTILAFILLLNLAACVDKNSASTTATSTDGGSIVTDLSGPVTIDFWHCVDNEIELGELNTLVNNFNSGVGKEMGITVNPVYQGVTDKLASAVTAAIKAGDVPDVIICEGEDVVQYLPAGCVVDLTPYMQDKVWGVDLNDYYNAFIDPCNSFTEEGYYMLPFLMSGEVCYYNVDFFTEHNLVPATTWEEYENLCRTITSITGKPASGWDEGVKCFTTLMEQYAGGYTDKNGKLLFADNMEAAERLSLWYQVI